MTNTRKESPEYLRMSLAAAMTLRFRDGLFYRNAKSHCINLLLTYDEGCIGNCAYCGLARERSGKYVDKSFIRVEWPTYSLDDIIARLEKYEYKIKRICTSMITNRRAISDLVITTQRISERVDIPISLLVTPTILKKSDLIEFKAAGAERIGIAVDTATPELFDEIRGKDARGPHRWEVYWDTIETAMEVFGKENVGVHFIVGIGETEKEMIQAIQRVRNMGGSTHLFSFFPEADSRFADRTQPPMGQYRRIQLGRYLIDNDLVTTDEFTFDSADRISDFGLPDEALDKIIDSGVPFETSGCPGKDGKTACNRPYANSLPGPNIRNFPFPLSENDVKRVREQLWSEGIKGQEV